MCLMKRKTILTCKFTKYCLIFKVLSSAEGFEFNLSPVYLENVYSVFTFQNGALEIWPLNGEQCQRDQQKAHLCAIPCCLSHLGGGSDL